jgi:hypothetical protein
LKVWQKPYGLCLEIYIITTKFPKEERQPWIKLGCFTYLMVQFANWKLEILLAGDLDLIEKGELGTLNKSIAEIERMLKALIKFFENKPLNP